MSASGHSHVVTFAPTLNTPGVAEFCEAFAQAASNSGIAAQPASSSGAVLENR